MSFVTADPEPAHEPFSADTESYQTYIQVGSRKIRPLQVGTAQVGMCQIAAAEIRHLEIDVTQIESGQISATEIKTLKTESNRVKYRLDVMN